MTHKSLEERNTTSSSSGRRAVQAQNGRDERFGRRLQQLCFAARHTSQHLSNNIARRITTTGGHSVLPWRLLKMEPDTVEKLNRHKPSEPESCPSRKDPTLHRCKKKPTNGCLYCCEEPPKFQVQTKTKSTIWWRQTDAEVTQHWRGDRAIAIVALKRWEDVCLERPVPLFQLT